MTLPIPEPEPVLPAEASQEYGDLLPPRSTVETNPLRRMAVAQADQRRAIERQERAAPLRNSSITGGEGQKLLAEDGTVRVWLRPDGTVVVYDETGAPKIRMGAMIETAGQPGADEYGIEVSVADSWIQLGTQVVAWPNVGDKPAQYDPATGRWAPSAHSHAGSDITGAVANATAAGTAGSAGTAAVATTAEGPTAAAFAREIGGIPGTNAAVWMHSTGVFGRNTSSRRYKENVRPAAIDPEKVLKLEPVVYDRKMTGDPKLGPPNRNEFGLIAEDVLELVPELVVWFDGEVDGVRYDLVATALLTVAKDQARKIAELDSITGKLALALEKLGVML